MARSKSKKNHAHNADPAALPKLPLDLIEIIAHDLVDEDQHRTCASLDMVCKAFKEVVDPILWKKVVFQWKNVVKGMKGEETWKTIFESDGAEYIHFLTIIPANPIDVTLDHKSTDIPFLSSLVHKAKRLQACIVTGRDPRDVGIYLFERYMLCSSALFTIMELVDLARQITKGYYVEAFIHPWSGSTINAISDEDDFATLLVQAFKQLPAPGEWPFTPLHGVGLVFPTDIRLPLAYLRHLLAELFALCRDRCHTYCDATENPGERLLRPMSVHLDFWGTSVEEAMVIGRCLKFVYYSDKSFGASAFRVRTAEPITPAQAKAFTRLMDRAYLSTHTKLGKRPPGPYIDDESAGSTLRKPQSGVINLGHFAAPRQVQGMLQYLCVDGAVQAIRSVLVPPHMGAMEIESLDLPH